MSHFSLAQSLAALWDTLPTAERVHVLQRVCVIEANEADAYAGLRFRQFNPQRQYQVLSYLAFGHATDFVGVR